MILSMPLSISQQQAVDCSDRSVLVLAGSNKTDVLVRRIAKIIESIKERHTKILGLTFTNKAAMHMQRQVEAIITDAHRRVYLTTFHEFSASLLRQHGSHVGISPNFSILAQEAERQMVLEVAAKNAEMSNFNHTKLLSLITHLLDYNISPNDASQFLLERQVPHAVNIGRVYENYRRLMVENNELDYSGLIVEALGLLRMVPGVRNFIQSVYPYVCVDEFQDTNMLQHKLLHEITDASNTNLFVVADDQIIYQWNGADQKYLNNLCDDFGCKIIELPLSYRCPPEIVHIANQLISHNPARTKKIPLVSDKQDGMDGVVLARKFESRMEECEWIADDIRRRTVAERRNCAILVRNRWTLNNIVQGLDQCDMPCHISIKKDEFESIPMAWLYAMLRLAHMRQQRTQLYNICRLFSILTGVHMNADDILCDSLATDGDHLDAWLRAVISHTDGKTKSFLRMAVPDLIHKLDFGTFAKKCFEWFDRLPDYMSGKEYDTEKKIWDRLVADVNHRYEQVTLNALLWHIDMMSVCAPAPLDSIPCYIIHTSKGLEFDHVYLAGFAEGILPDQRAIRAGAQSPQMAQERRVCFMAITRAKKSLALTYDIGPSRFLAEMGL